MQVSRLTWRERDILTLAATGETSAKGLSAALGVTTRTAESYKNRVYRKLQIHCAAQMVRYAVRRAINEMTHIMSIPITRHTCSYCDAYARIMTNLHDEFERIKLDDSETAHARRLGIIAATDEMQRAINACIGGKQS